MRTEGYDAGSETEMWLNRPLCRRYFAGIFCRTAIPVSGLPDALGSIVWALGFVQDGEFEVLGAWIEGASSSLSTEVVADLNRRGVMRVRFAIGARLPGLGLSLRAELLCARELGSTSSSLADDAGADQPRSRLSGPLRRVLASGEQVALAMQARLARAIARHGPLVDPAAGLDFVARVLRRAERELDVEHSRSAGSGALCRLAGAAPLPSTDGMPGSGSRMLQ